LAGTIAVPSSVLGANDRLRVAVIGAGERGTQLARECLACGQTELAGFADIYPRHLEAAKALAPAASAHTDYRRLLEDRGIDAVLIASPPHLHAEHFVAALEAGKHVYQEKVMALSLDHAQWMLQACRRAPRLAVQIGHQACSSGVFADAEAFLASGRVGKITAIHAHMFRNTPHGKPQWARPVFPDITPESIGWESFLGQAPRRQFDANRFVNWRFFWDYSGGNVGESMSQQLAFWFRALDLRIPTTVSMLGGVHLWKDEREVPDTMSVVMQHSEEILFTWDSGFGNNQLGSSEEVLGTDGTLSRGQQIRYLPQKVNLPDATEALGQTKTRPNAHMHDFLECIRTGKTPNAPVELGYRVSVTCCMAVESYRQGRTVRWDPVREEIV